MKSYKESIKDLVAKGDIANALNSMRTNNVSGAINLSARYTANQNGLSQGVLSREEYNLEHNRIVSAIVNIPDCEWPSNVTVTGNNNTTVVGSHNSTISIYNGTGTTAHYTANSTQEIFKSVINDLETALFNTIEHFKRRDGDITKEATDLLTECRKYTLEKAQNGPFDLSGRRLKLLSEKVLSLQTKVDTYIDDLKENTAQKISDLLTDLVPSWDKLAEAFTLCKALGFQDSWIAQQVTEKPAFEEVQIQIAERLEKFLGTLA